MKKALFLLVSVSLLVLCSCERQAKTAPYKENIVYDYSEAIYRLSDVVNAVNAAIDDLNAKNTVKARYCDFSFDTVIPTIDFSELTSFEATVGSIQKEYRNAKAERLDRGYYTLEFEKREESPITGKNDYYTHFFECIYDDNHDWLKTVESVGDGGVYLFEFARLASAEKEVFIAQNSNERLYVEYAYDYEGDICTSKHLSLFAYSKNKTSISEEDTIFSHLSDIEAGWVVIEEEGMIYDGQTLTAYEINRINGTREKKTLYE